MIIKPCEIRHIFSYKRYISVPSVVFPLIVVNNPKYQARYITGYRYQLEITATAQTHCHTGKFQGIMIDLKKEKERKKERKRERFDI